MIRVRILTESPVFRAGVAALLRAGADWGIRVADLEENENDDPSLVFVLIRDEIEKYREQIFGKKLVVLNGGGMELDVMLSDHPNGWGVLSFDASADDLSATISSVSRGMVVLLPEQLIRDRATREEGNAAHSIMTGDRLTQRELEVFSFLSLGKQNKEIAHSLGISENTVKFHISSIFTKLHVTNRTEALRIGNQMGIISQ